MGVIRPLEDLLSHILERGLAVDFIVTMVDDLTSQLDLISSEEVAAELLGLLQREEGYCLCLEESRDVRFLEGALGVHDLAEYVEEFLASLETEA